MDEHGDALPMQMDMQLDGEDLDGSSRVPPFLTKLCEILTIEDPRIICLNADAPSITIADPAAFAKEVLPRYFKHNKLGSFSQQLHTCALTAHAGQHLPALLALTAPGPQVRVPPHGARARGRGRVPPHPLRGRAVQVPRVARARQSRPSLNPPHMSLHLSL